MPAFASLEEMKTLSRLEAFGKQYYEETGNYLEYEKFLYVLKHPQALSDPGALRSRAALREQKTIEAQFAENYYSEGYLGDDFIPEGEDIAVEHLERYIAIPAHAHSFIEFVCVLTGECRHIINGNEYIHRAGDIAYVNVMTRHDLQSIGDSLCLTVKIRPQAFLDLKPENLTDFATPVLFSCGEDPFVRETLLSMWDQQVRRLPGQNRMLLLLMETLLLHISQRYRDTRRRLYLNPGFDARVVDILEYMTLNYSTVTLRSMAAHFHYNETYLSRLLREVTGDTFSQILRNYRLEQAARLLRTTDKKLDEICGDIGYADVTQFIHAFRDKFHTTPGRFRREAR